MEIEQAETIRAAAAAAGVISTIVGRCVMCKGAVLARGGETDGVLLPMQTRWVVLVHRGCWEGLAGAPGVRS